MRSTDKSNNPSRFFCTIKYLNCVFARFSPENYAPQYGIAEIMPCIYTFLCHLGQFIHVHLLVNISSTKGICYSHTVLQHCVGVRPGLECTTFLVHSSRHLYYTAPSNSLHQRSECFTGWTYIAEKSTMNDLSFSCSSILANFYCDISYFLSAET